MKNFIAILTRVVGLRLLLVRYHKARLMAAARSMKRFGTETTMPVWCSQRFVRHHQALLRLGFVVKHEFALLHRRVSGPEYHAFCRLMRARFPDDYWSCAASGARVIVTAPTSQMSEWQRFLSEYDQVA